MKTIKIKKATLDNGRLDFPGIKDMPDIPCLQCGEPCNYFCDPYPGDELIQVGPNLRWPVKINICNDITLEFFELIRDGEPIIFDKKRNI